MAETVNRYAVAHTRHRDASMVIVKIHPRFFDASLNQQERWYTDIQSCVRSVKLAGTVLRPEVLAQLSQHHRHEVGQRTGQQGNDVSLLGPHRSRDEVSGSTGVAHLTLQGR